MGVPRLWVLWGFPGIFLGLSWFLLGLLRCEEFGMRCEVFGGVRRVVWGVGCEEFGVRCEVRGV